MGARLGCIVIGGKLLAYDICKSRLSISQVALRVRKSAEVDCAIDVVFARAHDGVTLLDLNGELFIRKRTGSEPLLSLQRNLAGVVDLLVVDEGNTCRLGGFARFNLNSLSFRVRGQTVGIGLGNRIGSRFKVLNLCGIRLTT